MNTRWFYTHAGNTFGPYGGEELYRLAAIRLLQPADRLWPEGGDPQAAVEATAAIDFSTLPAPQVDPPDWLADVADSQRSGPQVVEWPMLGTPDWVEDMQRMPQPSGAILPVESALGQAAGPLAQAAQPESSALNSGGGPRGAEVAHGPKQAESSEDLYRRARAAIHAWAGLEANKTLILSGDFDAVRQDNAIQAILRVAERCGPHFADRFGRYLEFIVHTRRKYYLASAERPT